MKRKHLFILMLVAGCNANDPGSTTGKGDTTTIPDTAIVEKEKVKENNQEPELPKSTEPSKVYSNDRFKDVTVEKTWEHKFLIKGKGQIFEASFSWVVEDGHEELQQGHTMTDAGAPEWGNFSFTVDVPKKRENSTLHLILFESSAKDGSRQYELPVLLY